MTPNRKRDFKLEVKMSKNLRLKTKSDEFKPIKTIHSSRNYSTVYMPDESFKLLILNDEFLVGNIQGEIKVFDLSSMMLKKIIYL